MCVYLFPIQSAECMSDPEDSMTYLVRIFVSAKILQNHHIKRVKLSRIVGADNLRLVNYRLAYEPFSRCSWHFNRRVSNFNGSSRDLSYSDLVGVIGVLGDTSLCFSTCPLRSIIFWEGRKILNKIKICVI